MKKKSEVSEPARKYENELNSLQEKITEKKLEKQDFKKLSHLLKSYAHLQELLEGQDISAEDLRKILLTKLDKAESLSPEIEPGKQKNIK